MKQPSKFLAIAAIALGTSLLGTPTFAQHGGFSGGGGSHGGGGGFHGGGGGFHGGDGGFHGGHGNWGHHDGGGFHGSFFFGFPYAYAPYPYYYDPYYYYPPPYYYAPTYYSPPAVYDSPPAVAYDPPAPAPKVIDIPQQQSADRPPPPSIQRGGQAESMGVADVKSLASAGLSDEVIVSHIRNSQAVYHLSTAEIIDLKNSGVSDKVIDFMINTPSAYR